MKVYFKVPFYGQGMNCVSYFIRTANHVFSLIDNLFTNKRDLKIASYFLNF